LPESADPVRAGAASLAHIHTIAIARAARVPRKELEADRERARSM